jgi:hypothetical protein
MKENVNLFWPDGPARRERIEFFEICARHGDLPPVIAEQIIKRLRETENIDRGCECTPSMEDFCQIRDIKIGFFEHSCRIIFSCNKCANTWEPIAITDKHKMTDFIWDEDFSVCPNGCNALEETQ